MHAQPGAILCNGEILLELIDYGQALNESASQGATLSLTSRTGEPIPNAWLTLRSMDSPECQAEIKKAERAAAGLRARGDNKALHSIDRRDEVGLKVLAAAFVAAAPALTYNGAPLTAANIEKAFADDRLKFIRDQAIVFIADPENFPLATAKTLTPTPPAPTPSPSSGNSPSATFG